MVLHVSVGETAIGQPVRQSGLLSLRQGARGCWAMFFVARVFTLSFSSQPCSCSSLVSSSTKLGRRIRMQLFGAPPCVRVELTRRPALSYVFCRVCWFPRARGRRSSHSLLLLSVIVSNDPRRPAARLFILYRQTRGSMLHEAHDSP